MLLHALIHHEAEYVVFVLGGCRRWGGGQAEDTAVKLVSFQARDAAAERKGGFVDVADVKTESRRCDSRGLPYRFLGLIVTWRRRRRL